MCKRGIAMLLWVWMAGSALANTVQHVVWDKTPIRIVLGVDAERVIRFPEPISIVDSELDDSIGVMKLDNVLYLNAHAAFKNKRLVVQMMPEGEAVVLNLTAVEGVMETGELEVLLPTEIEVTPGVHAAEVNEDDVREPTMNPVLLTRFAIQSLYSPARLLITPPGVVRVPMQTRRTVTFVYGASVLAKPLISWQGQDLYVTAIELKNELNKSVVIDPKDLLGDWQTAVFYPTNQLKPRGSADTTTVFVTSSRPFAEALAANREYVR